MESSLVHIICILLLQKGIMRVGLGRSMKTTKNDGDVSCVFM